MDDASAAFSDLEFEDILQAFGELDDMILTSDLLSSTLQSGGEDLDYDMSSMEQLLPAASSSAAGGGGASLQQQQQLPAQPGQGPSQAMFPAQAASPDFLLPFVFGAGSAAADAPLPGPAVASHHSSCNGTHAAADERKGADLPVVQPSWAQSPPSSQAGDAPKLPFTQGPVPTSVSGSAAPAGWLAVPASGRASLDSADPAFGGGGNLSHSSAGAGSAPLTARTSADNAASGPTAHRGDRGGFASTSYGSGDDVIAPRHYTAEELLAGLDLQGEHP